MADRVRRPQEFEEYLTVLTGKDAVFKTYKDALIFAACLGLNRGKRTPFEKTSEPIHMQVFNGPFDRMVINMIAIADTDDPYVMAEDRENERIRIFEEFACGGLEIMYNECGEGHGMDERILQMIIDEEQSDSILEEITSLAD